MGRYVTHVDKQLQVLVPAQPGNIPPNGLLAGLRFAAIQVQVPAPAAAANHVTIDKPKDSYSEKLAKYVPAEAVTLFNAVYASLPPAVENEKADYPAWRWVLLALSALSAVGLQVAAVRNSNEANRVNETLLYSLSLVAFVGWALGTSKFLQDIGGADGVPEFVNAIVLLFTTFLVPLVDEIWTGCFNFGNNAPPFVIQ